MTNRRIRESWAASLNPFADAYGLVVLLLLAILVVPVITGANREATAIAVAILGGATAVISLAASSVPLWMSSASALFALASVVTVVLLDRPNALITISFLGLAAAMTFSPVAILNRIVRHRRVTPRTVLGAVAVYLQIGVAFAIVFLELAVQQPDAFPAVSDPSFGTFLYFSFITINTVGYGDIVPVEELGRTLSIFEALIGQIFLVVVVARVVALLGPGPAERARTPEEPPPAQP